MTRSSNLIPVPLLALALIVELCPSVLSCLCQLSHPQKQFCDADLVIVGTIQTKQSLHGPPHPAILPDEPTIISYKIQISNVKKGQRYAGQLWNVQDNELIVNTSATTVSCGVPWLEVGQRYVLTVTLVKGKASLLYCNFHRTYSELTDMQRRGINGAYSRGCEPQCQIYTCRPYGHCPSTTSNITCIHGNHQTNKDCYYRHGYCRAKSAGKCSWKTSPTFNACIDQE
ncbi:metalloproteinase inhibitor 3-like [Acanthaster planci]|uniref:Metalloproteinase inhibitor 3-like n=1 Tax=Acanthaster planci TaxID=133434 RepID=A0A8B7Z1E6_ACAPL|nr:metalloproteinase inhibitor 3-like [Acanthaster planci]